MTETGTNRPASAIEPGWQVQIDGEWVLVEMTMETEAPDGGGRIYMAFFDRPPKVVEKSEMVMSRPPADGPTTVDSGRST